MQSQQLLPGQALPPVRELAAELDINRNTVAAACKRLAAAGIALTQGRLGTVIRDPYGAGEQEGALPDTPLTDLASGNPRREWLPDMARAFAARPYRPRLYGEPTVNPGLETYGRGWLAPDCPGLFDINVTHGAVDAIERLLVSHLVPGDKVAVENPCFLSSINTLRSAGMAAIGVAMDDEGMLPRALEAALEKGARAVLITPRAHPGCSLSEARAGAGEGAGAPSAGPGHRGRSFRAAVQRRLSFGVAHGRAALGAGALVDQGAGAGHPRGAGGQRRGHVAAAALRLASGTSWVSHVLQDMVEAALGQTEVAQLMARARGLRAPPRRPGRRAARRACRMRRRAMDSICGFRCRRTISRGAGHGAARLAAAPWRGLLRAGSRARLRVTLSDIEPEQCAQLARDLRQSIA